MKRLQSAVTGARQRKRLLVIVSVLLIGMAVGAKIGFMRGPSQGPPGQAQLAGSAGDGLLVDTRRNATTQAEMDANLLRQAAWGGAEKVRSLLREGADVNTTDSNGDTPLILAAFHGSTEVVGVLLEHGADTNARNKAGSTALMEAAARNKAEIVTLLLASGSGAEVAAKEEAGSIAADAAGEKNARSKAQEPADHYAASGVNTPYARPAGSAVGKTRAMSTAGSEVDGRDRGDGTALTRAAARGDIAAVQLLLADKANPNLADPKDGRTALGIAAAQGRADIVRALLAGGADPNKRDRSGDTAMSIVQRTGKIQIGRLLKQAGAKTPSYRQVLSEGKP